MGGFAEHRRRNVANCLVQSYSCGLNDCLLGEAIPSELLCARCFSQPLWNDFEDW